MTDEGRRVYLRFAAFFLITGGAFLLIGVLRATVLPDVLRGNPIPVALLLLAIGGGLRWTVHRDPGPPEADEDAPERDEGALEVVEAAPHAEGGDGELGDPEPARPRGDDRPG